MLLKKPPIWKRLLPKKLKWWIESVQGLKAHLQIHKAMHDAVLGLPANVDRGPIMKQLRQQEGMVGHCLLHVLLRYPIAPGPFSEDELSE